MSALGVARDIIREGGVPALWRGVAPSLIMVFNPTVNYMLYEWLVAKLTARRAAKSVGAKAVRLAAADVFAASARRQTRGDDVDLPHSAGQESAASGGRPHGCVAAV